MSTSFPFSLIKNLWVFSVAAIFTLGLVMIFSTTSAEVLDLELQRSTQQALLRQIANAVSGVLLAVAVWKKGYRFLLHHSPLLLGLFTFFLFLVLLPGVGREVNGSKRWISLLGFSFQPSEFVKYAIPLYFISKISEAKMSALTFKEFARLLIPVSIPMILVLLEPNNGTVGVLASTLVVLFFVIGVPFKYWALPLLVIALVGGVCAVSHPYVRGRLKVYFDPALDIRGKGHQPLQAKIAAGSGGLTGKGAGNSWQKLSYLPKAQNDYIAAIFAEEFGFLGMLLLIFLYMLLSLVGVRIAFSACDMEGMYVAVTVTFLIGFQAFLNLGVVSGLLPSTGLNLPFFSQGGTSLLANLMGVGMILSTIPNSKSGEKLFTTKNTKSAKIN